MGQIAQRMVSSSRVGDLGLFHMLRASHRCGAVIGIQWPPKLLALHHMAQHLEREVPCQTSPSRSCIAERLGSCAAWFLQSCLAIGCGKGLPYYPEAITTLASEAQPLHHVSRIHIAVHSSISSE